MRYNDILGMMILRLLCFSLPLLVTAAQPSAAPDAPDANADGASSHQALVGWVRANGGQFGSKLEFRRALPGDPTAPFGVFATERIEEGELLMSVPWKCVFSSAEARDEAEDKDDERSRKGLLDCVAIHRFVDEAKKGDDSFYAPYLQYLSNQPAVQIPSTWSREAKDMLVQILAADDEEDDGTASLMRNPEGAVNLIDKHWKGRCGGTDDPFELNMAMQFYARADDKGILIPLYDAIRHRDGEWHNVAVKTTEKVSHDVLASRVIEKGEQIYNSRDICANEHNCSARDQNQFVYGANQILRDYGYVELMPQRWVFPNGIRFVIDEDKEGKRTATWKPQRYVNRKKIGFLRSHLRRLKEAVEPQLRNLEGKVAMTTCSAQKQSGANSCSVNDTVHPSEVRVISEYYEALTNALTMAINAAIGGDSCVDSTACNILVTSVYRDLYSKTKIPHRQGFHPNIPYYNILDWTGGWEGLEMIDEVESGYQTITYMKHRDIEDYCFDLDHVIQICSNQRPHYHEVATHVPAAYFDTVRRAAFVGGGDSMILHELLKYPSIELIIGLELDQQVTRQSFKYFKAQPHFDDKRVQWWFGDAAKTLNLLPGDYFGSFDIVVVDLSETVASNTVTTQLSIIEALAQLLQPNGILIKNELYFEDLSKIFDYTAQIYFEGVPVTLEWALAMGSNGVNFLHPPETALRNRPNIKTNFYELPRDAESHLGIIHDFRRNDARVAGKCKAGDAEDEADGADAFGGVLLVVEVENAGGDLADWKALEDRIVTVLQKVGLSYKYAFGERRQGVFVFSEGIVIGRAFPQEKYVAFDIQLWGAFILMANDVQAALSNVVGAGSDSLSTFRVVTGGMRGTSIDSTGAKSIGPRITQARDCGNNAPHKTEKKANPIDQAVMDAALAEALQLVQDEDAMIAVLCGDREKPCPSFNVLKKRKAPDTIIPIWECEGIRNAELQDDGLSLLFSCERDILSTLRESVEQHRKFSSFILDVSAHINMARIIDSIFNSRKRRREILMPRFVALASIVDVWRRNWLEWLRIELSEDELERRKKEVFNGTVCRSEVLLTGTDNTFEIGMVSIGDPNCMRRSVDAAKNIESRTGVQTEIRRIDGPNEHCQDNTIKYWSTNDDYDQAAALIQAAEQHQLGAQRYSQVKVVMQNDKNAANVLVRATQISLLRANMTDAMVEVFEDLGDGVVVVSLSTESTSVYVWDGGNLIDINIFSYGTDSSRVHVEIMTKLYMDALKEIGMEVGLSFYDEFPRGIGRIVNFPGMAKERGIPCSKGLLCSYR